MMKTPVGAIKVRAALLAVMVVIAVQAQTVKRSLSPTSLRLSPNAQGDLTGTSTFSLSSTTFPPVTTVVINPDVGLLRILCTWEPATPLTVSLTRPAGHGLHGTVSLISRTAQSPIALEARIEPALATRGPIYVEVRREYFAHGGRETDAPDFIPDGHAHKLLP